MSYMEFYSESRYKSRKERTCECCNSKINIGDNYSNQRGKWEGEFFQRDLCLTCANAISVFCSEVDDEFDYSEIEEDARERVCYDCDKNYDETCEEECAMRCPKVKQYYVKGGASDDN